MVRFGRCSLAVLSVLFSLGLTNGQMESAGIRVAKQAAARSGVEDQNSAETGFGGGGGGVEGSKYFHYQHLPEHDKYEFGFRRGNEHHVKERYEKAVPHDGHFKTKVRWADHKGGHGEHYWDYNHAGHGGDDDGEGGYSDPVPSYTDSQNANSDNSPRTYQKRQSGDTGISAGSAVLRSGDTGISAGPVVLRRNYSPEPETRAFSPQQPQAPRSISSSEEGFVKSFQDEIGAVEAFEIHRDAVKQKRAPTEVAQPSISRPSTEAIHKAKKAVAEIQKSNTPQLFFDLETGRVVDEASGKVYLLQQVSN